MTNEERLTRLEQQNKVWRLGFIGLALACLVTGGMRIGQAQGDEGFIKAPFKVYARTGEVMFMIDGDAHSPRVRLFTKDGETASVWTARTHGGSHLSFHGPNGDPMASIGDTGKGGSVSIGNAKGVPIGSLGATGGKGNLTLYNEKGKPAFMATSINEKGSLSIFNKNQNIFFYK